MVRESGWLGNITGSEAFPFTEYRATQVGPIGSWTKPSQRPGLIFRNSQSYLRLPSTHPNFASKKSPPFTSNSSTKTPGPKDRPQ